MWPKADALGFPVVRLTFWDCKGRRTFWGGKLINTKQATQGCKYLIDAAKNFYWNASLMIEMDEEGLLMSHIGNSNGELIQQMRAIVELLTVGWYSTVRMQWVLIRLQRQKAPRSSPVFHGRGFSRGSICALIELVFDYTGLAM